MKIGFWNTKFALETAKGCNVVAREMKELDADVVGILEVARTRQNIYETSFMQNLGYTGIVSDYSPSQEFELRQRPIVGKNFMPQMALFTRSSNIRISRKEAGPRYRLNFETTLSNEPIKGSLVHLDDRQEFNRLSAVADITNAPSQTDVIMGDFNAMSSSSNYARLYKCVRRLSLIPPETLSPRLHSIFIRLAGMAEGTTIDQIKSYGYSSADESGKSTLFLGRLGIGQVDYIFTKQPFSTNNVSIKRSPISDHAIVSANLDVS